MANSPAFSVIMPLYNKEAHVAEAIGSVLAQEFADFELIVVNDASTDAGANEVEAFSDSRVRLLHRNRPGPGGYAARNLGIQEARAPWIAFLDADDKWYPSHLKVAASLIECYPKASFVALGYDIVQGALTKRVSNVADRQLNRLSAIKLFAETDFMHTNCVVIKKSELLGAGCFPDGLHRRGGDSALWISLILASEHIVISRETTSVWQKDHSGIVTSVESTEGTHPVTRIVRQVLEKRTLSREEGQALKKVSNRKALFWSEQRKRAGRFRLIDIANFYPAVFSIRDWFKLVRLLLPKALSLPLFRRGRGSECGRLDG